MNTEENENIKLPGKPTPSDKRFCRKVRLARGNICENCGATSDDCQIESHHILDYHSYPEYKKDEENIIVVCQECHPTSVHNFSDLQQGISLMAHARLSRPLRNRIYEYIMKNETEELSGYASIIKRGEDAAMEYLCNRL